MMVLFKFMPLAKVLPKVKWFWAGVGAGEEKRMVLFRSPIWFELVV